MAHHAAELGAVLLCDHVVDPLETKRTQRVTVVLLAADVGLDLRDLELRHDYAPAPARARSRAAGATSSSGRPRRAAISSGRCRSFSACIVACTMLIGFEDPRLLESTSWMPAHSSTARTGPPAMTPVPGLAGLSSTTPAAASPCTGCGMVLAMRGTL